jgi:hypothetical protein
MVKEARARSSRSMPSADSRFLAPLWDLCLEHIGVDTLGHPLFFVIAVITTVLVAGAVFSFVDVFISGKLPFKQTALYLAITLPGYLLVFVLLRYLPIEFRFDVPLLAPSLLELARDLVICMVVGDVLSYWWHRLEHGSPLRVPPRSLRAPQRVVTAHPCGVASTCTPWSRSACSSRSTSTRS